MSCSLVDILYVLEAPAAFISLHSDKKVAGYTKKFGTYLGIHQLHGVTHRKTVSSKFGSFCLTFKEAHVQIIN
jgi:hypothetical protein